MGKYNISLDVLARDTLSFARDCIRENHSVMEHLEISNGENAAFFTHIIYKDPKLYWPCMVQMMNYERTKPASMSYISGYNKKASELGLPMYNSFGILVKLVSVIVVYYKTITTCE
jgi:hypothetical protein